MIKERAALCAAAVHMAVGLVLVVLGVDGWARRLLHGRAGAAR
jgi:hypothetical protein